MESDSSLKLWPAPAKLNLFLHVVGRRDDGYHLLQTLFQFLDLHDDLAFTPTTDGRITLATPLPGVPSAHDLTVRAATLLKAAAGAHAGVEIAVRKRIPLGGGLGGGSSDAATTLLALNALWGLHLSPTELAGLGLQLGADVPVFVHGHAAWAEGVGERLTPMDPACPWYVVLVPPVHVPTAQVFKAYKDAQERQLTHYSPAITIRDFRAGSGRNDLEPLVRALYPPVDAALAWLAGFGDARMTGSGACVFLPVESAEAGGRLLVQAPCAGFVARGLNVHPVHAQAWT
jgi:4-diphosphocytidyl-2-C-methyl-D-erythritol kinase